MKKLTTLAGLLSAAALLSACSTAQKEAEKPVAAQETAKPAAAAPDTRTVATVTAPSVDPLNDPNSPLAKRSVYFDFDSYVVKSEYDGVADVHAKYLTKNQKKVLIQGNTDERGGSEYNLALGQKRAEALRKKLAILGVPEAQMEAVSLGKEKPKAGGSDEASWAENRRDDIVYTAN
ncbi:peptidoglycan-associated lipoprotein Pal [Undibacterium sp.]|uniref:peptidoglycan-associated lipoprotein Pal n=1 Tax=Undibacterium sp. TaxID=1914977 RepID=UPI00374D12F2